MIKELKLPEIAENVDTATVLSLLVSEGDTIEKEQNVAEMESDKATFDLPSEIAGTVKEIKVSEGDDVKVGDVVLTVETDEEGEEKEKEEEGKEEEKEGKEEEVKAEEKKKIAEKEKEEKKEKGKEEKEEEVEAEKEKEPEFKGKEVPASPSVRRLARELGVDIHKVEGTGPADRITSDDVKSFAKEAVQKSDQKGIATDDYQLPDFSKYGEIEKKPMDSIRKRTAKNMQASWQTIPHVFQFDKADVTELEHFRKKYGKQVEKEGGKLTVTAIMLKIAASALETFPGFNASLDLKNKEIIYKKYINIGVAVDTERGLLVPVIREVDKKSITELSVELGEVAEAARNKKIKPDQLQGGNIAISNLGGIGGTNFTPIIYRPNVAIIGMSRTVTEPVYIDGEFKPRMMLPLSLSYDHRLIDGAEAARFLRWLCEALENPLLTMFKGGK
ncbi:MAG: 2-oxo acid dehydrogenase subunit E2 [Bacteroidales bacterium]|nr:2-oxo acid dehydrogenase subunit E2 [Bacteroidales bacterium]MCF8350494.1 2-oxo acid dehydrogenase subunit E2 [Bacteroidales bacterium]MCF8377118.1 2-oxo acid dehydrogenase subunit E2 [Bacteroidales bacterium]MCF8401024.1 2-oxo acid dehydrogenase subunit E2 [Bacteroidales bacterium]